MATSAESHSGGKATLTGVSSHHTSLDTVTRLSQTAHIEKPAIAGVLVFYVIAQSLGKSPDFCS